MAFVTWFQGRPSPYDKLMNLLQGIGGFFGIAITGTRKVENLLPAAPVVLTGVFQDIGPAVDVTGFKSVVVLLNFTKGDATNPLEMRWVLQDKTPNPTYTAIEPKYANDAEIRTDRTHIEPLPSGPSSNVAISLPPNNTVGAVKLQARSVAAVTATIDTASMFVGY